MKKILIFSLAYYPSFVSGAEAAIKEITDRINPKDIEFHMITIRFDRTAPREEKIGNVLVHRIGRGGSYFSKIFFNSLAAFKARALDKKHHFNALWAMMTYMLLPVVFSRLLGVRAPHILTLQDGDPYEKVFKRWFIRLLAPILDYGFRSASVAQAISTYLAKWPFRRGYKGKVEIIHNGANPRDLKELVPTEEIDAIKIKFGKKSGDIWLVNTARLVYQKASDDTIRALPLISPYVKFLVVGGGSDEEMLKNLARELGVSDRVIFTGQVDRSEVTKYRKAADIFVGPSRSEGLGNAFLSAMASRLPVVATQEGGLADFLFDAKRNPDKQATGWAVDKNSPEQIAEAVNDILAHPEKVKKITETARAMVLEKYDWDVIAKQMRERIFQYVFARANK